MGVYSNDQEALRLTVLRFSDGWHFILPDVFVTITQLILSNNVTSPHSSSLSFIANPPVVNAAAAWTLPICLRNTSQILFEMN